MYTACVSCDRDLGRNTELPGFPVGRRIAFDRRTGRLWVICPHCEEWNLAVLETRWEALEAAERLAAEAEVRVRGRTMGLARTVGGLELLPIGGVAKADIANWRYGRALRRRRRWAHTILSVLGLAVAGVGAWATDWSRSGYFGLYVAGGLGGIAWWHYRRLPSFLTWGRTTSGRRWFAWGAWFERVRVEAKHAHGELVLVVPGLRREMHYIGRDAIEILVRLLAAHSWAMIADADIPDAVAWVDAAEHRGAIRDGRGAWRWLASKAPRGRVTGLSGSQRLALEMALREELEHLDSRRAADGRQHAFVEADAVGRISDDLLMPADIVERVEGHARREPKARFARDEEKLEQRDERSDGGAQRDRGARPPRRRRQR